MYKFIALTAFICFCSSSLSFAMYPAGIGKMSEEALAQQEEEEFRKRREYHLALTTQFEQNNQIITCESSTKSIEKATLQLNVANTIIKKWIQESKKISEDQYIETSAPTVSISVSSSTSSQFSVCTRLTRRKLP